jgi:putative aldouronate transport system permease protein
MMIQKTISQKKDRRTSLRLMKRYWIFYAFFLPVAVYYIIFKYIPIAGIQIAFKDYSFKLGIWGSPWTSDYGFKYFIRFLSNGELPRLFSNTMTLSILGIVIGFPAPIILALLLNEMKWPRYKRVLQSISYLPYFVSFVVVYAIMHNFFSYNGFINGIRSLLGQERILYLGSKNLYKWFYVLSSVWKGVGWSSVIYLAALSRVDIELYEAADLDGATRLQKTWHITLASLRPLISLQFIMTMGGLFSTSFSQTLIMLNDMNVAVAETIDYYIYQTGLLKINQYSYSAAVGLFNALLSLMMVILTNTVAKKIDEDGGIW